MRSGDRTPPASRGDRADEGGPAGSGGRAQAGLTPDAGGSTAADERPESGGAPDAGRTPDAGAHARAQPDAAGGADGAARRPRVAVLALQGDVGEHLAALSRAGADPVPVRRPDGLSGADGVVIPGGESTTIGRLARDYGLIAPLRELVAAGTPVWGTCAGLILLADAQDEQIGDARVRAVGRDERIGGLDVRVRRNAFGRQVDSFEADLGVAGLETDEAYRGVFIRAPAVTAVGPNVDVLARLEDGTVVAVRQEGILGTAFHPELTGDLRFHRLFVRMCRAHRERESTPG